MTDNGTIDKILDVIRQKDDFMITSHVNPEGDSIGSQLALGVLLERLEKKFTIVNNDPAPYNLKFLKGIEKVLNKVPENFSAENIIVLDCPVKERTGRVSGFIGRKAFVINIDHHVSNGRYGDVNWVDDKASSVGEMLFRFFERGKVKIDRETAEMLYASIVTDTGSFNYGNTSADTHRIAGVLLECGADPVRIHSEIYENKSYEQIKLLGKVIETLSLDCGGRVSYLCLYRDFYNGMGRASILTDEFINFARSIKGIDVAVFFKEQNNDHRAVNVSFRSTGNINVDEIASFFGGGGHPKASGCVINADMETARKTVLEKIKEVLDGSV